jgi:RNA recognition motif-containing protein
MFHQASQANSKEPSLMEAKLYVGNLAYATTESTLQQLFSQSGQVTLVNLVKDHHTGQAKGFAFVTMASEAAAQKAILKLNDTMLAGRRLTVSLADQNRAQRPAATRGKAPRSNAPRNSSPKDPAAYQSKLDAFSVTKLSPKANAPNKRKPDSGYQSKLGAFGEGGRAPALPRRRGGTPRH